MSEALLIEWARLRDEVASVRRILAIPEGADVVDYVTRVAYALADSLHPLAPWPRRWTLVENDQCVALDLGLDGACRAYVIRGAHESYVWEWRESAGERRTGRASSALGAIADCMARLEVTRG